MEMTEYQTVRTWGTNSQAEFLMKIKKSLNSAEIIYVLCNNKYYPILEVRLHNTSIEVKTKACGWVPCGSDVYTNVPKQLVVA